MVSNGTEDGAAARARRWLLPAGPGVKGSAGAWDEGCEVTTYIDGLSAMSAMRDALEGAIAEAGDAAAAGLPPGRRGYVHLAAWRLNGLRDLSEANAWALEGWTGHLDVPRRGDGAAEPIGKPAEPPVDQTVLGLLLRLLQAGVRVRALLWLPTILARASGFGPHIEDHLYIARVVEAESRRLSDAAGDGPLGVVALDLRVARRAGLTASHHAKVLVVRGHRTGVAFCGGMDLAYTRRHSPPLIGDWQSGSAIPDPAGGWPRAGGVDYSSVAAVRPLAARQRSDLPARVYGDGRTSATRQLWHDQHLRVRGPAVVTIEDYLRERWTAAGRPRDLSAAPHGCWRSGQVLFSTPAAFDAVTGRIHPLPPPTPVAPVDGTARVQVWRTDPGTEPRADPGVEAGTELGTDPSTEAGAGAARTGAEGDRVAGTYTMMAGTAHACGSARELIWIIDQYFWSRSLARLLNRRLKEIPSLRVLLLLPPFADKQVRYQHRARALALADLVDGVGGYGDDSRVAVYDLWAPRGGPSGHGRGIYAHAKTQLYDGSLLVCGSANMNRRSFTCDTELACAVVEPAVVAGHQRRLWSWLFPGTPWPGINLDRPGGGRAFLEAVRSAVAGGSSLLIPDPWWQPSPALPGGIARPDLPFPGSFRAVYAGIIDPTSLPAGLERASGAGDAARGPADLERLSARVTAGDPAKVRSAKARSVRARSASARPGGHSHDRFRR